MSLNVAIQMDPIETIDIDADSTFAMALEAQSRGHRLWHYLPNHLGFLNGAISARAQSLQVRPNKADHFTLGDWEQIDLATMDVVLMRQDPPFDMGYITSTHLLELLPKSTLVVNDAAEVRNAPEKLFITKFADYIPPTLISADMTAIRAFREAHRDIIVKPLFGNGGAGVFHLKPDDENLGALIEMFAERSREPLMIQRYLPEIRQGDKRIILIDGEPLGAVSRMPQEGEARANFHAGGKAEATDLTPREREICAALKPILREKGLIFVGIDVIGDYLTEINVTSPTGIHEINRLSQTYLQGDLWDAIEARVKAL
ncbi:MAG: glutathione synthase [Pseudomonadota bacterium]